MRPAAARQTAGRIPRPPRSSGKPAERARTAPAASRAPGRDPGFAVATRVPAGGQPLDAATRAFFEPRFGVDLGAVRVHTGADAVARTRRSSARASTRGSDIYFNAGQFDPAGAKGRYVLAHELAHVAQLRPGASSGAGRAALEHEANASALAVLQGRRARIALAHDGRRDHHLGDPDTIPALTFIATAGEPSFLADAVAYHTAWGLAPRRVASMEAIVTQLATATGHIDRLRIVTHANPDLMLLELFAGGAGQVLQAPMAGFGFSDRAGMEAIITAGNASGFLASMNNTTRAITALRTASPAVLGPFGLTAANAAPSAEVARFLRRCLDHVLLSDGTVTVAGQPPTTAQSTALREATNAILDGLAPTLVATTGPTAAQVAALRTAVAGLTQNDLNVSGLRMDLPADMLVSLTTANRALAAGFRGNLDRVKARFDETSTIDIRGCRIGRNPGYLRAIQSFFGRSGHMPTVSGPDWFTEYPQAGFRSFGGQSSVDAAASSGITALDVSAADMTTSTASWSALAGATALLARLTATIGAGSDAVVGMRWQSSLPRLEMESELDGLRSATLAGALTSLATVFELPRTARPSAANVTALAALTPVAASLTQSTEAITALSAQAAPAAAALQAQQAALRTIEGQLTPGAAAGSPASSATAPTAASLQTEASRLRTTLRAQLTALDPFMAAMSAALAHANAALRFYLNLGWILPVQSSTNVDRFAHLVMAALADRAITRWLNVQWRGTVPTTALLRRQQHTTDSAWRHIAAATSERPGTTGRQTVFSPTAEYASHIIVLDGGNFQATATGTNATTAKERRTAAQPATPATP